MKTFSLDQIIEKIEGKLVGQKREIEIENFSDISCAKSSDVALMFRDEERKYEEVTEAKIIICNPFFVLKSRKTFIFTEFSYSVVIALLEELFNEEESQTPFLSKTAIIDKSVHLPDSYKIYDNVVIEKNVILGDGVIIQSGAIIKEKTVLEDNVNIDSGAIIGANPFWDYIDEEGNFHTLKGMKGVYIGKGSYIGAKTVIERGVLKTTRIGRYVRIGSAVTIGHDVEIGDRSKMVDQSGIAGLSSIGSDTMIYAQTGIMDGKKIGNNVIIYAKSGVRTDIPDNSIYSGIPAIEHKENIKNLVTLKRFNKMVKKWGKKNNGE